MTPTGAVSYVPWDIPEPPSTRKKWICSSKALQEKYEKVSQQMNALFYQGFSPEEQGLFEQYLARILDTLSKNLPSGSGI